MLELEVLCSATGDINPITSIIVPSMTNVLTKP